MSESSRLERFGGWDDVRSVAVSGKLAGQRPFFAGSAAYERMDLVRQAINEIRSSWDRYPVFMDELRELMRVAGVDLSETEHNDRLTALLSSTKEWATSTSPASEDGYEVIRLYTSKNGYRQIFSAINEAFRSDDLVSDKQRLRSATFLVELLNIDLFNYRAAHEHADNFQGTVYRGMSASSAELEKLRQVATGPLAERYLSVPLAMVSASTAREPALAFALNEAVRNPDLHPAIWEIHVESLDPGLLDFYRERFPDSVVTSLCAVPIDQLSDFPGEKEVLLRGPHFQIIGVSVDDSISLRQPVHKIKAVALNSNRDHITAIASNKGTDRRMRDLFRALVLTSRSTKCADQAEAIGRSADAELYRTLAAENRALVDSYR
jgi:hypothetical protein